MQQTKRLNINLPASVYKELQKLSAQSGRSMTEVIRTGFGLAKVAMEESAKNRRLAVTTPDGKILKEIVITR